MGEHARKLPRNTPGFSDLSFQTTERIDSFTTGHGDIRTVGTDQKGTEKRPGSDLGGRVSYSSFESGRIPSVSCSPMDPRDWVPWNYCRRETVAKDPEKRPSNPFFWFFPEINVTTGGSFL